MYSVELKIKRKSLADEARAIRKEEKAAKLEGKRTLLESLHHHRLYHVRRAARAAHLAHAFLGGMAYARVERTRHEYPNVEGIGNNLKTFGGFTQEKRELAKIVIAWVDEGVPDSAVGASNPSLPEGLTPSTPS